MYLNIQMFGGRGAYSRQYKINSKSVAPSTSSQTKASIVSKDDVNKLLNIANENEPQITADLQDIISKTSGNINYKINNFDNLKKSKESVANSIEKPTRHYYEINEQRAKYAHQMYSMRDYKENQTTNMYKAEVDGVYEMALEAKTKCNNDQEKIKKIDYLTDKFSKQYAEWLNKESELKLRYPSQMITGAGGWTPNKIARKESAFNNLFNELKTINKIKEDIKNEPFKVKRNETKGVAVQSDRYESKYFKVIQNEQENRLQLKFDGKPDEETRSLLKKNGYKFSPSRGVWQRQLTNNARYSVRLINEALDKMNKK